MMSMPPRPEDCYGFVIGLRGPDGTFVPINGIQEATFDVVGSNPIVYVHPWAEPEEMEFSLTRQSEKNLRKLFRPAMNRRCRMIRRFRRQKEKLRRDRLKGKTDRKDVLFYI